MLKAIDHVIQYDDSGNVIPVLEPLRIALGMELVDCTNMRC